MHYLSLLLSFLISFSGLLIASYTDLKKRIVPNTLNFSLLITGIALHLIASLLTNELRPIIFSLASLSYSFAFAYLLYRFGVWAGGDVKLFAALAALNPVNPFIAKFFGFEGFVYLDWPLFPIQLFVFTVLATLPVNTFILLKQCEKSLRIKLLSFLLIGLLAAGLSLIPALEIISGFLMAFAAFSFISFLLAGYLASKLVLVKTVKITDLSEGEIPAENIRLVKGKTVREKDFNMKNLINNMKNTSVQEGELLANRFRARGVSENEIKKLRELVSKGLLENNITIKQSAPMVPAILTAFLILNLTGDILWQALL